MAADLVRGLNIYHVLKHFISLEMKSHLGRSYSPLNDGKDRPKLETQLEEAKLCRNCPAWLLLEAINKYYVDFSPLMVIQKNFLQVLLTSHIHIIMYNQSQISSLFFKTACSIKPGGVHLMPQ